MDGYKRLRPEHIPLTHVSINENTFTIVDKILVGLQGHVYLVEKDGQRFILKIVLNVESYQTIVEHKILLHLISCDSIIKMIDMQLKSNGLYMIFPYAEGGDLMRFIYQKKYQEKTEHEIYLLFKQLFDAVDCMHSKYIVHLDIKPANIVFMDEKQTVLKLIDLGSAENDTTNQFRDVEGLFSILQQLTTHIKSVSLTKLLKSEKSLESIRTSEWFKVNQSRFRKKKSKKSKVKNINLNDFVLLK